MVSEFAVTPYSQSPSIRLSLLLYLTTACLDESHSFLPNLSLVFQSQVTLYSPIICSTLQLENFTQSIALSQTSLLSTNSLQFMKCFDTGSPV